MRTLVFGRRVVALLALRTSHRHNDPHSIHLQPQNGKSGEKRLNKPLYQRQAPFLIKNRTLKRIYHMSKKMSTFPRGSHEPSQCGPFLRSIASLSAADRFNGILSLRRINDRQGAVVQLLRRAVVDHLAAGQANNPARVLLGHGHAMEI